MTYFNVNKNDVNDDDNNDNNNNDNNNNNNDDNTRSITTPPESTYNSDSDIPISEPDNGNGGNKTAPNDDDGYISTLEHLTPPPTYRDTTAETHNDSMEVDSEYTDYQLVSHLQNEFDKEFTTHVGLPVGTGAFLYAYSSMSLHQLERDTELTQELQATLDQVGWKDKVVSSTTLDGE